MRLIIFSLILVVFGAFCVAGCSNTTGGPDDYQANRINRLKYYKDTRTNLCYAVDYYYQDSYFTNVPCDKVESMVEAKYGAVK